MKHIKLFEEIDFNENDFEWEDLETKTYTRDDVIKIIYKVLEATGKEIQTIMHIGEKYVEFDGDDLEKWIKKNV